MKSVNPSYKPQVATRCACGGACEERMITVSLRRSATSYALIHNVPAEVCEMCGEEHFSLPTTERIIALLHSAPAPQGALFVPLYDLAVA